MSKSTIIGLVVVAVIAVGGYFAPSPAREIVREVVERLGAFPGADFGDCISQNGIRTCTLRTAMDTASSTLCVIPLKSVGATSTLLSFQAHITTSATGAFVAILENRPNSLFAPALSVATSVPNTIGSIELATTLATGTVVSINASSSERVANNMILNNQQVLGSSASSSLVFFAKSGDAGSINQAGIGRVV